MEISFLSENINTSIPVSHNPHASLFKTAGASVFKNGAAVLKTDAAVFKTAHFPNMASHIRRIYVNKLLTEHLFFNSPTLF